jgi:FkbH-like protein
MRWEEHCLECAPPVCYQNCPLFVARADQKCARFVYGIVPNWQLGGLFDHAADLRFRRWGKLEAKLTGQAVTVGKHQRLQRVDEMLTGVVNFTSNLLQPFSPRRRLNGAWAVAREKASKRVRSAPNFDRFDDFVLECFSPDPQPLRLVLELFGGTVPFRHAFDIEPGHNYFTVPATRFGDLTPIAPEPLLKLYPQNDREARLLFTWLDFVRYVRDPVGLATGGLPHSAATGDSIPSSSVPRASDVRPAAKVKCVVWDLDNTLWDGILIDRESGELALREDVASLVRALDERGILQSVASKNDHDAAWGVVQRLGLDEFFLSPAIGWGQKSAGIRQIAANLNIGLDTFALIDDSAFERAEVESALPMVRTFPETGVADLLSRPEFDVPVTVMSRERRQSYRTEMRRQHAAAEYRGDYDQFLRDCQIRVRLFVPRDTADVHRCWELVQRSNQLNLSGRRYTPEEFAVLLPTPGVTGVAIDCEDRFGAYGTVGFCNIDERGDQPLIRDFVLSCRVAQKRIEHTFFAWAARRAHDHGHSVLRAELVKTARNGPLAKVFDEMCFRATTTDGPRSLLELSIVPPPPDPGLIALSSEVPDVGAVVDAILTPGRQ